MLIAKFPESAKNDTLKLKYLIGQSLINARRVIGVIEGVTIEVFARDNVHELVEKLKNIRRDHLSKKHNKIKFY